ncbi:MAG: gliding motility-associated C-terminal domain-containing protein [Vicingaceae bacterium]
MKRVLLIFFLLHCFGSAMATHNRAGEITYRHISGSTYEFTVTIYADPNSAAFQNRQTIEINWGDNTGLDSLNVTNVIPISGSDNVSRRDFVGRHTFAGPGTYKIAVSDPNRNAGIDNISNSVNVPFYVECILRIFPFGNEVNNSPVLLYPPIDDACVGRPYLHNPGAYDPDGDSLVYKLTRSRGAGGSIAPGYEFPPFSSALEINPETGDFLWDFPILSGTYNISIRIQEYRDQVFIGEVVRDMQIEVYPGCGNDPPVIDVQEKVCVEAGQQLVLPINGSDVNNLDEVSLSVVGEALQLDQNPAIFNSGLAANPIRSNLSWNTNCLHVRKKPYQITIRATDNAKDERRSPVNLVSFQTAEIRIVAPSPKNFSATPFRNEINLNWDAASCFNAEGYYLYRRLDSSGFVPGSCQVGVPQSAGFEKIATLNDRSITTFKDDNQGEGLTPGRRYCYLITAFFEDGDESYASTEVCAEVDKFVPIITNNSVVQTDQQSGSLELAWSPPDTIDAVSFPAPYRYLIYLQSPNGRQLIDSTLSLTDTTYTVSQLNTIERDFTFQIELFSYGLGKISVGRSPSASSVFLNGTSGDNKVSLNWQFNVPWENDSFVVFRRKPLELNFSAIDTVTASSYVDSALTNGQTYAYYVSAFGDYELSTVKSPLINLSQEIKLTPVDNEPPCSPIYEIEANCDSSYLAIRWQDSSLNCTSDITTYRVYRSRFKGDELNLLREIQVTAAKEYILTNESIAGVYLVSALDSVGNESDLTDTAYAEYCPRYQLPNIFTPNGDGVNDLFIPYPNYRYVDSIDLAVFNRWGELVFETSDPAILWDGVSMSSNQKLNEGVYYYSCTVYELSLDGLVPRNLKGTVNIQAPTGFRKSE